jgi:GT2 family glycosyltransferase
MALSELRLPRVVDPTCSLVMVVYGGYETARRSVASVVASTGSDYEMIIVDNASPDGAGRRLAAEVDGARFVFSDQNLGYGTAADLGALHARGQYLGILNSDIAPSPGWLESLVGVLETDPSAGAVGPMYLTTDGRVQEAGMVLGSDAIGYGYGDQLPAGAPEINFRRYVDYVSAAALLVRTDSFRRLGGFDPIYGLGYYEDADLCFGLREIGLHAVYEPRARVTHVGQASFTPRSRMAQVDRNRPIFVDRFATQLDARPRLSRPPFDPHKDLLLRDWWCSDRIAFIDRTGRLQPLARAVQAARPHARVTWLGLGGRRWDAPVDPGIERFDLVTNLPRWLESRRFHYNAVITDGTPERKLAGELRASQSAAITVAAVADSAPAASRNAIPLDAGASAFLAALGMR